MGSPNSAFTRVQSLQGISLDFLYTHFLLLFVQQSCCQHLSWKSLFLFVTVDNCMNNDVSLLLFQQIQGQTTLSRCPVLCPVFRTCQLFHCGPSTPLGTGVPDSWASRPISCPLSFRRRFSVRRIRERLPTWNPPMTTWAALRRPATSSWTPLPRSSGPRKWKPSGTTYSPTPMQTWKFTLQISLYQPRWWKQVLSYLYSLISIGVDEKFAATGIGGWTHVFLHFPEWAEFVSSCSQIFLIKF